MIYPFTVISGTVKIGADCRVGPFTHLRDGTVLDDGVEVGAFVEVNRSHIESGTIARHLAYLGDAVGGPGRQHRRGRDHGQFRRHAEEPDRGSATGPSSAPVRSWSPRSRSARMPSSAPGP